MLRGLLRVDAHSFLALAHLECDNPFNHGVEGVIGAFLDIEARMNSCASLSDDDVAGDYSFAAVSFDAQSLGVAIATVSCGACALLMCHYE